MKMKNKKIEFFITDHPRRRGKTIVPFYEEDGKTYAAKAHDLVFEELPEGQSIEGFGMCISNWKEFATELVESLKGDPNILNKEAQNEAELSATKYHLEDMRSLLKIKRCP